MKCDELKAYKNIQPVFNTAIQKDAVAADDYDGNGILFEESDEVYLKSEADKVIAELEDENAQLKKEIEFMHSNCKWNAGDGCARLLGEKLAIINENVEIKRENRKLKRALWLARAERADDRARIFYFCDLDEKLDIDGFSFDRKKKKGCKKLTALHWRIIWLKVERKCRAKAEQYL